MEIFDVHNHYYPPEYLAELKKGHSTITVDEDAEGNPRVHYPGDYNIVVKGPEGSSSAATRNASTACSRADGPFKGDDVR